MRTCLILFVQLFTMFLICPCALAKTSCDVKKFGAKGDGTTKDTAAIQEAIESCARSGGIVDLHDGVFLSGTIHLKSGVTLRIERSATLKGIQDETEYPEQNPPTQNRQFGSRKALIYAENTQNIRIDGGGTIDGSGGFLKWLERCNEHSCNETGRPIPILILLSSKVEIENIFVKDAAMWSVVLAESENISAKKIRIHSPFGPTRDGIDIVDSQHVLIENSEVYSEDDAFCMKSGVSKGVYDVTIRNSKVLHSTVAHGVKFGTGSVGGFKKIRIENLDIQDVGKAAMAVESIDGGDVDDVRFKNIKFHDANYAVFIILGRRTGSPKVGSIQNVSFSNIEGDTRKSWGSAISGTIIDGKTYSPKNITFENVNIDFAGGLKTVPKDPPEYQGQYPDPDLWDELPASAYFIRHVDGIAFTNSSIRFHPPDAREPIVQRDVSGFVRK